MDQRDESIERQRARTAVGPAAYIGNLRDVDFSHALIASNSSTKHRSVTRNHIPLLSSLALRIAANLSLEPPSDLPAGATYTDLCNEIRATKPNTQSPLQFVFPPDTLVYSTANIECVETPFHVCVNHVDRSIWLCPRRLYT